MDAVPFHIGIVTGDLTSSMKELGEALGVSWTEPSGNDRMMETVDGTPQLRPMSCISKQGPIHIDLIQGDPGTLWHSHEPRLHHFAFWTSDLRSDIERLTGEGWRLEMTFRDADGLPTTFAYMVRDDGFELIDDAGRADYGSRLK
jgi:glyoxalase/bleomycin resistance protein/dioxygenase superfamily protein